MRSAATALMTVAAVAGCSPTVTALAADDPIRVDDGYTHVVSLIALRNDETKRMKRRALKAAQRACGVHPASGERFLRIQRGIALGGNWTYLVDCSSSEKDSL